METLIAAVTNILLKPVTEEEAKEFALNNYAQLACYIKAKSFESILNKKETEPIAKYRVRGVEKPYRYKHPKE